jgi:hypothetical protein
MTTSQLDLFLQAAAQTGGVTGRIFLARVDALDHNRWPEAFRGLLGQKFFEQANNDAPARTLGTPLANDPEKHLYFQRLDDLSRELATKLLEMKQAAEIAAASPGTPPAPEAQPPNNSPVVFLAEATPDLDDLRDNIRRYLNQANIRVLPEIGRIYRFGDWAKLNKASKRPLTHASLRCKRWLNPSSLHRIPTPLKRCWISHVQARSTMPDPSGHPSSLSLASLMCSRCRAS